LFRPALARHGYKKTLIDLLQDRGILNVVTKRSGPGISCLAFVLSFVLPG
jgi:hypothetical protein